MMIWRNLRPSIHLAWLDPAGGSGGRDDGTGCARDVGGRGSVVRW